MQISASDVIRTFRHDQIALFVSAASITVAMIALAYSAIRRRADRLILFFAWFAALYGIRLWMQSGMRRLMTPQTLWADRLELALTFLVAIPAAQFFAASMQLGRLARGVVVALCLFECALIAALFTGINLHLLNLLNSGVVLAACAMLAFMILRLPSQDSGGPVIRTGILLFLAFVLWSNAAELLGRWSNTELYGFVACLVCLGYVTAQRTVQRDLALKSIQQELEVARGIQRSILPMHAPASPYFTVAARYKPMTSVAGDFYDYLPGSNGSLGLLIADVSGHGVPAALIASMVKVALQTQQKHATEPGELIGALNQVLCGNAQQQFVTAAYVSLDAEAHTLRYAAAGHPPMLLLRGDTVLSIEENGLLLAAFPHVTYATLEMLITRGDRMLLYTDGLTEATNGDGEEYGRERLQQALLSTKRLNVEETTEALLNSVKAWAPAQEDDLTVVVCDYLR